MIPPDIKNSGKTEEFARTIKCWTPKNWPCMSCLNYIHHVGYVNFGTNHSEVFWQTERVPILAGDLRMAASALKCYSQVPFFLKIICL